jgi:hypothetical protein
MRMFIQIASWVIVALVIVYAFTLIGSPGYNRLLLEDEVTIQNIDHIRCAIRNYYNGEGEVPKSLAQLQGYKQNAIAQGCSYCNRGQLQDADYKDGMTRRYYEYTPAPESYTLCANFHADWDTLKQNRRTFYFNFNDESLHYKSGRFCFKQILEPCKKH